MDEVSAVSRQESTGTESLFVLVAVLCLFVLGAYVDASFIRRNDFFVISSLVTASVHTVDMFSDASSAVTLLETHTELFVAMLCLIVGPALVSVYQLSVELKKWRGSDEVDQWLSTNAKWLFLVSGISGSAFTAVRLARSDPFQLALFQLPLSKMQLNKFLNKELFSTVLLENIPQLCIQGYVVWLDPQGVDNIVLASMIFSVLSAVSAVWGIFVQRNIVRRTGHTAVEFVAKDKSIRSAHTRKVRDVEKGVAAVLELKPSLVEALRPTIIRGGVKLQFSVAMNYTRSVDANCEKKLKQSMLSGDLAEIVHDAWKLPNKPLIDGLVVVRHESKQFRKHAVQLSVVISAVSPSVTGSAPSASVDSNVTAATSVDQFTNQITVAPRIPSVVPDVITPGNEERDSDSLQAVVNSGGTSTSTMGARKVTGPWRHSKCTRKGSTETRRKSAGEDSTE